MSKIIFGIILAVAVVGGAAYWYMGSTAPMAQIAIDEFGSYPYMCDNGVEFTMAPSSDMSTIALRPGANAQFAEATLAQQYSAGARYEGAGMIFTGAGEEVTLTTNDGTVLTCMPKPSQEMAPFNWGDQGEGAGSTQPDAALVAGENMQGKWQSVDDAKFVREFKANDAVADWYDNEIQSEGMWVAFTKENAPEVPFPLKEDTVYVQMTITGSQADTLNFELVKVTPEELEMVYLDRGGMLRFKRIQ
jgi:hypothetical protein